MTGVETTTFGQNAYISIMPHCWDRSFVIYPTLCLVFQFGIQPKETFMNNVLLGNPHQQKRIILQNVWADASSTFIHQKNIWHQAKCITGKEIDEDKQKSQNCSEIGNLIEHLK